MAGIVQRLVATHLIPAMTLFLMSERKKLREALRKAVAEMAKGLGSIPRIEQNQLRHAEVPRQL